MFNAKRCQHGSGVTNQRTRHGPSCGAHVARNNPHRLPLLQRRTQLATCIGEAASRTSEAAVTEVTTRGSMRTTVLIQ